MLSRIRCRILPLILSFILLPPIYGCQRASRAASAGPSAGGETVSIGYGTQRREDVTGSISSLSQEEIGHVQAQDMERLLIGRIPGLQVVRRGADVTLSIRGGGPPHVVINGAPATVADLLSLPPESVRRIDVRKDGGAAVYGFRSAHGVIEVTTRRGRD